MDYPLIKPSYYYSLFLDIIRFIKKPNNSQDSQKSTLLKTYDTIGLLLLKFICLIPVVLFFALVYDPPNVQSVSMAERFSPIMLLLLAGVILPLIEEIAFRLSLKFKPIYLALSSTVLLYYFLNKAIFHVKNTAFDETFTLRVGIAVTFGIVMFSLINISSVKERLAKFWSEYFRSIFYFSCVLFAWVHITKYEINAVNILLLPILTLPQLMSAIIYGYIRVSFGFRYPLFLYMAQNLLVVGLSLLASAD